MPAYKYEAANEKGTIEHGVLDADSPRHARNLLRQRSLVPIQVAPVHEGARQMPGLRTRLSRNELTMVTRQLASLLAARVPLERALGAVIEQAERAAVRDRFAAVRADVVGGQTFAQALARHPDDFPDVYRALVGAGEQSGDLGLVMGRLADYIESRTALTQKLILAFTYPMIVTVVAVLVVIAMLTYVVPQVVGVFEQTRQNLPPLTVAMIAISDFVRVYGIWLLAALIAALIAFRVALRAPTARLAWHRRLLEMPLFGRMIRGMNTARFASTLAILASAGVPLIRAIEAGSRTLTNESLRAAALDALERVREGAPLSRALAAQKQFPPMMIQMIASGEATGEVGEMLERVAATLSTETERRALTLTSLLEPALILAMGGIVLLIVLAVLMPIIEINQLVR
ncbi:MAG: type II secretion system inner membrane protein GspF [Rhodospirillales bacterium]|nr:type II secretion system inner membrane protein GspF [Rhodospirillales bacterium]